MGGEAIKPDWRGVALAGACCGALLVYGIYLGALSVLLPVIGADFRLGADVSGRLFPATFFGFVTSVSVCGYLSDRYGRKRVLLMGIAVYGIGLALFGRAPGFDLALWASALIGAGSGVMETVASAQAAELFPRRGALVLNLIQVAFGIGAASGPVLAHSLLLHTAFTWRTLYAGLAVANALLFAAFAVQPAPPPRHGTEALDMASLRQVLKQPSFVLLCLAQALYVGAEVSFFSWMPTYFRVRVTDGAALGAWAVTIFWIAMTIGRIVVAAFAERIAPLRLVSLLAIGAAVSSALALVRPLPLPTIGFVALTGLCLSGIFSLILTEAGRRYPQLAGTVFGGVLAFAGVGGALFPWVIGVLAATPLGWRGALLLIPVLGVGIAATARRLETRGCAPNTDVVQIEL